MQSTPTLPPPAPSARHGLAPAPRAFSARYTLRNGSGGVLVLLATSSCAAILIAIDTFGTRLRTCSALPGHRPAHRGAA